MIPDTLSIEWHRRFEAARAARTMPRSRRAYKHPINALDFIWEFTCPLCPKRIQSRDRNEVEVEALLHTHHRGPSTPWHPRYLMPPRYRRYG